MSTGFLLHLKFSSSTIKSNFGSSFSKGNKSTIEILKAESSLKLKKWLRYWSLLNRIPFVPIVFYVPFSLLVWRSFVFYMRSFLHALVPCVPLCLHVFCVRSPPVCMLFSGTYKGSFRCKISISKPIGYNSVSTPLSSTFFV